MPCVAKRVYPKAIDELPEWLRGLKGYDVIVPALRDGAESDPSATTAWQVSMALPLDASSATDDIDPLVMLVMLAYGRASTLKTRSSRSSACAARAASRGRRLVRSSASASRPPGSDSLERIDA